MLKFLLSYQHALPALASNATPEIVRFACPPLDTRARRRWRTCRTRERAVHQLPGLDPGMIATITRPRYTASLSRPVAYVRPGRCHPDDDPWFGLFEPPALGMFDGMVKAAQRTMTPSAQI